jgi:hypothetical protein
MGTPYKPSKPKATDQELWHDYAKEALNGCISSDCRFEFDPAAYVKFTVQTADAMLEAEKLRWEGE